MQWYGIRRGAKSHLRIIYPVFQRQGEFSRKLCLFGFFFRNGCNIEAGMLYFSALKLHAACKEGKCMWGKNCKWQSQCVSLQQNCVIHYFFHWNLCVKPTHRQSIFRRRCRVRQRTGILEKQRNTVFNCLNALAATIFFPRISPPLSPSE